MTGLLVATVWWASAACASDVSTSGSAAPSSISSSGSTPSTSPGQTTGSAPSATAATGAPRPSPGCGSSTVGSVEVERHPLDVGGVERFYLLTTPPAHDGRTPLPLVLDFHGLAEGAQVHSQMSNYGATAKKEGFVVAFPHGQGAPVRWDANMTSNPNADLTFVDQMLDDLGATLCIDTSRVYATGLSYGAIWSSFLTCTRTSRFAAVAPVAGMTIPEGCAPTRPMPAIAFHGTADPILSFNGGVGTGLSKIFAKPADGAPTTAEVTTTTQPPDLNGPGYPKAAADWAARNGCKPGATDTKIKPDIVHRVYDCPANAAVELYIVIDGGHAWPGSEFSKGIGSVVGPTTMDISATELSWKFFQRFQLP